MLLFTQKSLVPSFYTCIIFFPYKILHKIYQLKLIWLKTKRYDIIMIYIPACRQPTFFDRTITYWICVIQSWKSHWCVYAWFFCLAVNIAPIDYAIYTDVQKMYHCFWTMMDMLCSLFHLQLSQELTISSVAAVHWFHHSLISTMIDYFFWTELYKIGQVKTVLVQLTCVRVLDCYAFGYHDG